MSAPPASRPVRPLYWSVRRELWESRSLVVAPTAAAALLVFAYSLSTIGLPRRLASVAALDPLRQRQAIAMPYSLAAALVVLVAYAAAALYCLDALHGERRDRSILFWKSLPVSDLTTVVSKSLVALVVVPLTAIAVVVTTQVLMLCVATAALVVGRGDLGLLWSRLSLASLWAVLVYGLAAQALWHAPLYAWLLLVSAWARRSTFLWALLPPLGVAIVERVAFRTTYVAALLRHRLVGAMGRAFAVVQQTSAATGPTLAAKRTTMPVITASQIDPLRFVASPGLWAGLAVAALLLALAVRVRRRREPI